MQAPTGNSNQSISRRNILQSLGAATTVGLAGCGGGDTGDTSELGEQVPTQPFMWWTDLGGLSQTFEDMVPIITDNIENRLGVPTEVRSLTLSAGVSHIFDDQRGIPFGIGFFSASPARLDPTLLLDLISGDGDANIVQWINCEYTDIHHEQQSAANPDERRELVYQAQEKVSEDKSYCPMVPFPNTGAYRTDLVEVNRQGNAGLSFSNPFIFLYSEPQDDNQIVSRGVPELIRNTNFPTTELTHGVTMWNHLWHSTFVEYDENYELQNALASNIDILEQGTRFEIELADATFHNGDQITSEDVKFTYEFLQDNNTLYSLVPNNPFSSIEIVDEKTTAFVYDDPWQSLLTLYLPRWGIVHKESWEAAGANDDPTEITFDEIVGSGPFRIRDFELNSYIDAVPHDGHPVHQPDHDLYIQVYENEQSALSAFQNGEIGLFPQISATSKRRIDDQMGDVAVTDSQPQFTFYFIHQQCHFAPTKFVEFRDAVGTMLDRQAINEQALDGLSEPFLYATQFGPVHPFIAPLDRLHQFTDQPDGDEERARQVLEDAGWGWDEDGNLHYPPDADLSPQWPAGEGPGDYFPCIRNEDGGRVYVPPSER